MSAESNRQDKQAPSKPTQQPFSDVRSKWLVLLAIGIGTFMSALDTSVVNTVLPIIREQFSSSVAAIEWVVLIYLLLVSGMLLIFGRLGDLLGHRPIYLAGFLIFILSSVLCGLAVSTLNLVAVRGLQALGAAMLSANSPAILTKSFPAAQRGRALGLQATMTYLGLTVGPSLGGWLTDQFSWRAVFYINVPVGLLALWLSYLFVPHDRKTSTTEKFDFAGAGLFMTGLVILLLALNQGPTWGWLSPLVAGLLVVAVLLLSVFIWIEGKAPSPMLDIRLFGSRQFSAAVASAVMNYICVYSVMFLMPFYLLQGRGFSPSHTGLLLTAMPIIMAIVAPISGTFSDSIGTRIPAMLGMAAIAIGELLLARLGPAASAQQIVLALGVTGLGVGTFISPNTSALMGAAPRRRQGIAAGVLATSRNVGMVLGIGLSGAVFNTILGPGEPEAGLALYQALEVSLTVAAVIAAVGFVTSAVRSRPSEAGHAPTSG